MIFDNQNDENDQIFQRLHVESNNNKFKIHRLKMYYPSIIKTKKAKTVLHILIYFHAKYILYKLKKTNGVNILNPLMWLYIEKLD